MAFRQSHACTVKVLPTSVTVSDRTALERAEWYPLSRLRAWTQVRFQKTSNGGDTMLPFDSYRDVLSEHARGHHIVASAWFIVAVIAVSAVMSAA